MANTRKPIRVLICNKHTMFRDGIKALFGRGGTIKIVGEAATAGGAIRLLRCLHPDIVLMDTVTADLSGDKATERIKALDPHVQVLIVSLEENGPLVSRCLRAGAAGYVRNQDRPLQLRDAINMALRCASRSSPRRAKARREPVRGVAPRFEGSRLAGGKAR